MRPDLLELLNVVERHEGLVLVEIFQGFEGLDRVCVDDPVPDPVLPFLVRKVFDEVIDNHELGHRSDIETGTEVHEGFYNFGVRVRLDCKIDLNCREILLKLVVVLPDLFMVDYKNRSSLFICQFLEYLTTSAVHMGDRVVLPACVCCRVHVRSSVVVLVHE